MSNKKNPVYRRILLKISGESFQGDNKFGIDVNTVKKLAQEIKFISQLGVQVSLVIGSGNLFRGGILCKSGINLVTSHHIGILSTIINSLAMKDAMHSISTKTYLMSAIPINGICNIYNWEQAISLLSKNVIVIFSAGIGSPCFTTDSAACLRGIETRSDIVLKGTKVDGVYSSDPKKDKKAILYRHLKYKDVLKKELKVMDLSAFILARDHNLPIRVFNINKKGNLYRIIIGKNEGTLIHS
ncbi:UMP kinase [Buchnera aphidicola (Muscaphis stroyani)]|uniref:Uridylate kinase n=1 Tax=Buchnera aphidicola (Muscaphis stroyani) TaxID=1241869 RepID=A0A4D6Y4N4_9GAMM|nr:UMP kinase [Buchnera aphidicola]QCI24317.1 UMP kinase [Buchnera aphidicola (Muscaphis stroyani)]